MLKDETQQEIIDFLEQIPPLTTEDFETVDRHTIANHALRKEGRPLVKLSGADFNWLDKRVRDVTSAVLRSREWPDVGLSSGVTGMTGSAAQAIVRRDRLSPEQYEAFVGGFRLVGVLLPPHPDQAAAGQV